MECIEEQRINAMSGGGKDKVKTQHSKGKLSARERIMVLADKNSFEEFNVFAKHRCSDFNMNESYFYGDGVITGTIEIEGRLCFVCSQDFTVMGGSLGEIHAQKICRVMDMAMNVGCPFIQINDSGGARIQEGVDSLGGYGEIFSRNVAMSGIVPQISLIMGPCAGGAVYSPALTDFIFMTRDTSFMFLTGPEVVKKVTYEEVTAEELGGAEAHSKESGVIDLAFDNDLELLRGTRKFLRFIPSSSSSKAPSIFADKDCPNRKTDALKSILPKNPLDPYDVRDVINEICDQDSFFEIKPDFAKNISTGFARMEGKSVGIIANQPLVSAGCLDIDSSRKAARFIRFCDAFNIPILSLIDVPGFLPGVAQEYGGVISHGAKLAYAYAEATVPRVSLILRKAYGGAYIVMSSRHLGGDINYALPESEIAVMGPDAAVSVMFGKKLQDEKQLKALTEDYRKKFTTPMTAAARGFLDDVIKKEDVRIKLCSAFRKIHNKKVKLPNKKHDNLPL